MILLGERDARHVLRILGGSPSEVDLIVGRGIDDPGLNVAAMRHDHTGVVRCLRQLLDDEKSRAAPPPDDFEISP